MVTVTTAGLAAAAKLMIGVDSIDPFTYIAAGSGSTAESADQTALITEHTSGGLARAAATCTTNAGVASWVVEMTNTSGGILYIREVGLFNAASGGTMYLRHVYTADQAIKNGETVRITITDTNTQGA